MMTKKGLEHEEGEWTNISLIVGIIRNMDKRSVKMVEGRTETTKWG